VRRRASRPQLKRDPLDGGRFQRYLTVRRFIWWLAPVYSAAVSVWLLVVPNFATAPSAAVLTRGGLRIDPASMQVFTSLLVIDGWWVVVPLLMPIALSVVPLLANTPAMRPGLAVLALVLLVTFSFLARFSIGNFYLPAAAVLLAAALIPRRRADPFPPGPAV
jgi:hypothetical protein